MHFFLKPESGDRILFAVLDSCGNPAYRVAGEPTSLGCRYTLRGEDGSSAARMSGVTFPSDVHYSISAGSRHILVTVRPEASHRAVRFKGVRWRFRGNILVRSFDIVEDRPPEQPRVIMTHGRCWNRHGDCYAIEIPCGADVPLALCTAVAVDCAVVGGCVSPVPVN